MNDNNNNEKIIKKVLILIAMEQEAELFVQNFNMSPQISERTSLFDKISSKIYFKRINENDNLISTNNILTEIDNNNDQNNHNNHVEKTEKHFLDIFVVTNGRDERFDCNNVIFFIYLLILIGYIELLICVCIFTFVGGYNTCSDQCICCNYRNCTRFSY